MALTGQNFNIWRGDVMTVVVVIDDAFELSGFDALWTASIDADSPALLSKTSVGGGLIFDGNKVLIPFSKADTDKFSVMIAGNYLHQLRLTDSQGHSAISCEGMMTVKEVIDKI